jgi:hypothetical protein
VAWQDGRRRSTAGLVALLVGVSVVGISALRFHEQLRDAEVPDGGPWRWFVVGIALCCMGLLLVRRRTPGPTGGVTAGQAAAVLAVAVMALLLRVVDVGRFPFGVWYDEAQYGVHARRWLTDPAFRPVFIDHLTGLHLYLFTVGERIWGTASVVGLRVVSAVLATVGVILAYAFGREWRGHRVGLVMAVLLATSRWSINFSRIGMTGAELPTTTFLVLLAALRLSRRHRMQDAVVFGAAVAAGLWGYGAFHAQALGAVAFVLATLPYRIIGLRRVVALGAASAAVGMVLLVPLLVFVGNHPDVYFERARTVSVVNEQRDGDRTLAGDVRSNLVTHLGMFHLSGDRNGRHNLPGEPMLDPVTGALLVVGIASAVRERSRVGALLGASLALGLLNGVMSVTFEAPQALRSIGVLPAIVGFAAVGLDAVVRLGTRALSRRGWTTARGPRTAGAVGVALLVAAATMDARTYFVVQRRNPDVWRAYSADSTLVAHELRRSDPTTTFLLSPLIGRTPVTEFLARSEMERAAVLVMPDAFPLRSVPEGPVLVLLTHEEAIHAAQLREMYPNGRFSERGASDHGAPGAHAPSLLVARLTPEDVAAIQGLEAGRGVIHVPAWDRYVFVVDAGVRVEVDGEDASGGVEIQLARGTHAITVDPPGAALRWRSASDPQVRPVPPEMLFHGPVTPNGLVASFVDGTDVSGAPTDVAVVPFVNWLVHILPRERPYSVRYDGYVHASRAGTYRFVLMAVEAAALSIDGATIIERAARNDRVEAEVTLSVGWHRIQVRHEDTTSHSRVYLEWAPPGVDHPVIVPQSVLCPALDRCRPPG